MASTRAPRRTRLPPVGAAQNREAEDNLLRVDRALAGLRAFAESTVGAGRSLYILSADHGFDDVPEYRRGLRLEAGRYRPDALVEWGNRVLAERFGGERSLVWLFWNPCLYVDERAIAEGGLSLPQLSRRLPKGCCGTRAWRRRKPLIPKGRPRGTAGRPVQRRSEAPP